MTYRVMFVDADGSLRDYPVASLERALEQVQWEVRAGAVWVCIHVDAT